MMAKTNYLARFYISTSRGTSTRDLCFEADDNSSAIESAQAKGLEILSSEFRDNAAISLHVYREFDKRDIAPKGSE
jgi:hypothetical protein